MPDEAQEGQNLDPDAGQAQVQARMDVEHALGYVPSDGASLGGDEDLDPEELAAQQAEANKQFTMPPDGLAAEKPVPPHSAEAASSEESDSEPGEDGRPAKSASREEWDAYAEAQGEDPAQFGSKQELIDFFS